VAPCGVASYGLAPYGVASRGVVSRGVVSCGVASCAVVSCGAASRAVPPYAVPPYAVAPYAVASYAVASCAVASCGVASCGVASCGVASCGAASCGVASCGAAPCAVASCGAAAKKSGPARFYVIGCKNAPAPTRLAAFDFHGLLLPTASQLTPATCMPHAPLSTRGLPTATAPSARHHSPLQRCDCVLCCASACQRLMRMTLLQPCVDVRRGGGADFRPSCCLPGRRPAFSCYRLALPRVMRGRPGRCRRWAAPPCRG
jgi:hypothetical protein